MKNFLENITWYFHYGHEKLNALPRIWRMVMFFVGLLLVYFLWQGIFMGPLSQKIAAQQVQKAQTELKIRILEVQQMQLTANVKKIEEIKSKETVLKARLEQLATASGVFDEQALTSDKVNNFVKSMLTNMGLTLDSLQITPKESLSPTEAGVLGDSGKKLYKKTISVTFRGNFFGTLNYLKGLEKLSWQIYWDDFNYNVTKYPEAVIGVKLHVLSM